jgi:ASC-1-like (ASCH) protein
MERTHRLKTWPEYFKAIKSGAKNFELRKDDRHFKIGDILILQEWEFDKYSGNTLKVEVTYLFHDDGTLGLMQGYCIMSIKLIEFYIDYSKLN